MPGAGGAADVAVARERVEHEHGVAAPLVEAPTPGAAIAEARARVAPVLLSRHILALAADFTVVALDGLEFPRTYELVTPAFGEPTGEAAELVSRIRDHIRIWLR